MTLRGKGFTTLAAAACLLLLVGALLIVLSQMQETALKESKARIELEGQTLVWKTLANAIESFSKDWKPLEKNWIDFAQAIPAQEGVKAEFSDGSARLNINGILTFLLSDSNLKTTLKDRSVDEFQEYRTKNGPFLDIQSYSDYFQKEALEKFYTTFSLYNVNTVDEFMLERLVTLRTGNAGSGSSLRDKIRQQRSVKAVVGADQLKDFLGADEAQLTPLITTLPELNVNTVNPVVLDALIKYPAWAISNPDGKIQTILDQRKTAPLTIQQLVPILGVPNTHRVFQYLGTDSLFLQGQYKIEERVFKFVLFRAPPKDNETATIRILEAGWSP